jgi:putative phosphoesterase
MAMRLLIVSDIHANKAALDRIDEPVDGIVFLGDAVDYGPCPTECVSWVREFVQVAVQGNHDFAVANDEDPRCSTAYREMADATWDLHRHIMEPEDKAFLQKLRVEAYFEFGGALFYAVHAAPADPLFKYLPRDISNEELAEEIAHVEADVILLGHTHIQCVRRVGPQLVVNPGSVGLPKDGDPRAAYAIWDDGAILLRRVPYPVEKTVRQLQAQPLPRHVVENLARVLRSGEG